MPYAYSQSQLDEIRLSFNNEDWPTAYRKAAFFADGATDANVIAWLNGAADINAGVGDASDFVRQYTAAQYFTRFGEVLGSTTVQDVSNKIAEKVIKDILESGETPTIEQIVEDDATPAATDIFRGNASGWAGNPMFLGLGQSQPLHDNILHVSGDTYDALAMVKFTLQTFGPLWTSAWQNWTTSGSNIGTMTGGFLDTQAYLIDAYGILGVDVYQRNFILGRVDAGDALSATSVFELLHGGDGDDTLSGLGDGDILDGGQGEDEASYVSASGELVFTINPNRDGTVAFVGTVGGSVSNDWLYGIELVTGTADDDEFRVHNLAGSDVSLKLDGGAGDDVLDLSDMALGAELDLTIGQLADGSSLWFGIKNFEHYVGTDQADVFILDSNVASLDAGDGDDTVVFNALSASSPTPVTIDGGSGDNALSFDQLTTGIVGTFGGAELAYGAINFSHFRHIVGTSYDDTLTNLDNEQSLDGAEGDDTIFGSGDGDELYGGTGDDNIEGGDGDDVISGGAGHDMLYGGDGDDLFSGGGGGFIGDGLYFDGLYGGAGDDKYNLSDGAYAGDYVGANTFVAPLESGLTSDMVDAWVDGIHANMKTLDYATAQIGTFGSWVSPDADVLQVGSEIITSLYIDFGSTFSVGYNYEEHLIYSGTTNTSYDFYIDAYKVYYTYETDGGIEGVGEEYRVALHFTGDISFLPSTNVYQSMMSGIQDDVKYSIVFSDGYWSDLGISLINNDDTVWGDEGLIDAFLYGPSAGIGMDSVYTGGESSDAFNGGAGDDNIDGGGGDDILDGGAGDDLMTGGAGDDDLDGGDGYETFWYDNSPNGFDAVSGGEGTDTLYASSNDTVIGLRTVSGIERITGEGYSGVIVQGSSDGNTFDFSSVEITSIAAIDGGGGDDVITGNGDANLIYGGEGGDGLNGGAGDDQLAGEDGADVVVGGDGYDTAVFYGVSANFDFTRQVDGGVQVAALAGTEGGDLLEGVEAVYFEGDATWKSIEEVAGDFGTAGNDAWIAGTASADSLFGLAGDDVLFGQDGDDIIDGGDGDDQANYDGSSSSFSLARNADGSITVTDLVGGEGADILTSIEAIYFDGDAAWNWTYDLVSDYGASGDDYLLGMAGADNLYGLQGDDVLRGLGGDDLLDGGDGADEASYVGSLADFDFQRNEDGSVTVVDNTAAEGTDTLVNIEALYFEADAAGYLIEDLAGEYGTSGADAFIQGSDRGDRLYGLEGNDNLFGNDGDDDLHGGAGDDVLEGGNGGDYFVFGTGLGHDTVSDFDFLSGDKILISQDLADDYAALGALTSQVGLDVLITFDSSDSILLKDMTASSLGASDFIFT